MYKDWLEEEQIWDHINVHINEPDHINVPSNPTTSTCRMGADTDGVYLVLGEYFPEGILSQEADLEIHGGFRTHIQWRRQEGQCPLIATHYT